MTATVTDFEVRRDTLADTRVEQHGVPEPGEGQVLMKVDLFSLTANNITYAVFGEAMRYWDFFSDAGAWGRVPVWGFGDVVASRHAGVAEGTRVYGYFPMATHRLAEPGRADAGGFVDVSGARGELAPVYSQYMATGADPLYAREDEDQIMLFRPLFTTSFILDDWLAENGFFGAQRVILSSASSKTSLGLAFLLKTTRGDNVRVAGLTSAGNRAFVEGTGCYDEVIGYDEIEGLDAGTPAAFVDMAGNSSVRARVHTHFKDALKLSSAVGGTHWEAVGGGQEGLPGPKVELFFAPTHIERRIKEWGGTGFQQKVAGAWRAFIPESKKWISVSHGFGPEAVRAAYQEVLDGKTSPDRAHVLSLWPRG